MDAPAIKVVSVEERFTDFDNCLVLLFKLTVLLVEYFLVLVHEDFCTHEFNESRCVDLRRHARNFILIPAQEVDFGKVFKLLV